MSDCAPALSSSEELPHMLRTQEPDRLRFKSRDDAALQPSHPFKHPCVCGLTSLGESSKMKEWFNKEEEEETVATVTSHESTLILCGLNESVKPQSDWLMQSFQSSSLVAPVQQFAPEGLTQAVSADVEVFLSSWLTLKETFTVDWTLCLKVKCCNIKCFFIQRWKNVGSLLYTNTTIKTNAEESRIWDSLK